MRWSYPRFRVHRHPDGWHIWWIPANDPIRRIRVAESLEAALAHIDYLSNREPTA